MNRCTSSIATLAFATVCTWSAFATAADRTIYSAPDKSLVFLGGVGYTWLKADELVFDSAGNRISKLIWQTNAPVLTAGLTADANGWTFSANAVVGFSGNSHMEDYDWLELAPSFAAADWSNQSIHPDTHLDRYINLDLAAGRDFAIDEVTTLNLHGGFKYTNVKWSAYGGSYIGSVERFRDTRGKFPHDEPLVDYEQRYPGFFLGVEATTKLDNWALSGLVRGGLSINARAIDLHWPSRVGQYDFRTNPFISVGAKADYRISDRASLFLTGNFDEYFRDKGDTTSYELSKGAQSSMTFKDSAGLDFYALTMSAGFKLTF
ncbi:omptin family outer membrane protease [Mesorhizobium ciceri]|uniref:omptin family outer membrane protease n=1 Tax=Mesorhizobium TaxID=68287 RepID=UPI000478CA1B|nr:omptin family outer membrane protease [Mesorhizobium ciceri]